MRARQTAAVHLFSVIAVPAENLEVFGKPELYDFVVLRERIKSLSSGLREDLESLEYMHLKGCIHQLYCLVEELEMSDADICDRLKDLSV